MFEAGVEGFGRRILSEAKHVAAPDARQAAGSGDHEKAQRAHAAEDIAVGLRPARAPRPALPLAAQPLPPGTLVPRSAWLCGPSRRDCSGDLAPRRGSALGELATEPRIARGIEERLDLGRREPGAHVRIVRQGLAELAPLRDGGLRRLVDRVVGPLPADLLAK